MEGHPHDGPARRQAFRDCRTRRPRRPHHPLRLWTASREGRHFAAQFTATQGTRPVYFESVYAAQSAELLWTSPARDRGGGVARLGRPCIRNIEFSPPVTVNAPETRDRSYPGLSALRGPGQWCTTLPATWWSRGSDASFPAGCSWPTGAAAASVSPRRGRRGCADERGNGRRCGDHGEWRGARGVDKERDARCPRTRSGARGGGHPPQLAPAEAPQGARSDRGAPTPSLATTPGGAASRLGGARVLAARSALTRRVCPARSSPAGGAERAGGALGHVTALHLRRLYPAARADGALGRGAAGAGPHWPSGSVRAAPPPPAVSSRRRSGRPAAGSASPRCRSSDGPTSQPAYVKGFGPAALGRTRGTALRPALERSEMGAYAAPNSVPSLVASSPRQRRRPRSTVPR